MIRVSSVANLVSSFWPVQIPKEMSQERSGRWSWAVLPIAAWIPSGRARANLKNGLMTMRAKGALRTPEQPWEEIQDAGVPASSPARPVVSSREHLTSRMSAQCTRHLYLSLRIPSHGCSRPSGPSPFLPERSPGTAWGDKGLHFLLFLLLDEARSQPLPPTLQSLPGSWCPHLPPAGVQPCASWWSRKSPGGSR